MRRTPVPHRRLLALLGATRLQALSGESGRRPAERCALGEPDDESVHDRPPVAGARERPDEGPAPPAPRRSHEPACCAPAACVGCARFEGRSRGSDRGATTGRVSEEWESASARTRGPHRMLGSIVTRVRPPMHRVHTRRSRYVCGPPSSFGERGEACRYETCGSPRGWFCSRWRVCSSPPPPAEA